MKKHIYIYSPSGAIRDKSSFKRGVRYLEALNFEVEVDPDALTSFQRFAGSDEIRIASIHRAAASGADIAMISRGGYGLTRLLGKINYKALHRAVSKGTQFVGLSDFTALQLALFSQTGATSWAGPCLMDDFGIPKAEDGATVEPDDIMVDCFNDLVTGQGEATGWRLGLDSVLVKPQVHIKDAVLWGGNLTVMTSLIGTPYLPDVSGGVLFLEDVAEHPYRIERMLTQMLHAGILNRQKAIVLGQFTAYKLNAHDRGFKFKAVIDWLRTQTSVPILTNLPFGHVQTKVVLPVGLKVDLVVEDRDALLLWSAAH